MKRFRKLTSILLLASICSGVFDTTAYASSDTTKCNEINYTINYGGTISNSDYDSLIEDLSKKFNLAPSGTPSDYAEDVLSHTSMSQGAVSLDVSNLNAHLQALTYGYVGDADDESSMADYYTDNDPGSLSTFIDSAKAYKVENTDADTIPDIIKQVVKNSCTKSASTNMTNTTLCTKDSSGTVSYIDISSLDFGLLSEDGYITNSSYSTYTNDGQAIAVDSAIGIYNCLLLYTYHAIYSRENMDVDALTPEDLTTLKLLQEVYDSFSGIYPVIDTVSNLYINSAAGGKHDKSLKDLWSENKDDLNNIELSFVAIDEATKPRYSRNSPLNKFYSLNNLTGIASINRDMILSDIDIDYDAKTIEDAYNDERKTAFEIVNEGEPDLTYNWDSSGLIAPTILSLDSLQSVENGVAVSFQAVSMSEYIQEGLANSATYIPLKTNVYSPDTINQLDEDFRNDFFYKYGFMRKALFIDTSSSAAVDYYNANGKSTGTLEVCTLRDLMESDENDVVLYIDDNFYNVDEAISEGTTLLNSLQMTRYNLVNELQNYMVAKASEGESEANWATTQISAPLAKYYNALVSGNSDDITDAAEDYSDFIKSSYNYNLADNTDDEAAMTEDINDMLYAIQQSTFGELDYKVLKHNDLTLYSDTLKARLDQCEENDYREIKSDDYDNEENYDTFVLPSRYITDYMDCVSEYSNTFENEEEGQVIHNAYSSFDAYSPMLSLAYVSSLYRYGDAYSLANATSTNNPVFIASDDLCGIEDANQWYRNTILNYALLRNLKSSATLDYSYVVDLDCPVYMDVFGNILTESGTVVIPAACNMTLHTASYKNYNVAVGLYAVYGHDYHVPLSCTGASTAMYPFFTIDYENNVYVINGVDINLGGVSVKFNELSPNKPEVQDAIKGCYLQYINGGTPYCRTNWIALVNIVNEVMRGAPVENIDKDLEGLNKNVARNKAAVVAAVKLEELINNLQGQMSNTLLSIPDFSRSEHTEYFVAFMIKILIVVITAVIIIAIYRDGVSGNLGLRTLYKSVSSVALTFAAVCIIPAVFQLTYYSANKFLLHAESMRILMYNLEKYQSGVEIGMLETTTPESTNDMSLQLDWITVPWYNQLENILYKSSIENLDEVKKNAYRQSPVYNNYDVELYNDGVYVSTDELFSSVNIDYTFNEAVTDKGLNGLYLYSNNDLQTASFYSPYYVFLRTLTANVNEYNYYHNSYNYTTKYMSGNRLKTVGLCNTYFTTKGFMEEDDDILHLYEIYGDSVNESYDRALLFSAEDRIALSKSLWYYNGDKEGLDKRVIIMNNYARDFIADNKDLLTKVTDETFLKVMALNMAIKYNQVFGINSANALEIYNMDSNDLLRLSIVPTEEAVLAAPMSYSRFVYNFGGEPAVYAAAVLTVIMWLGSFIKPLCTVIVFVSVFMSIVVFRVILRKPSANLLGYLVTVILLCFTNLLHAILLKISTYLPNTGLSPLGCLIFLILAQVVYLLFLGYVTGVSLRDWQNLGATEYEKEARLIKRKFKGGDDTADLSGNITHHDNNWDYYNDLVNQHRRRNV